MNTYQPGDTVNMTHTIYDGNGALFDPAQVFWHVHSPNGVTTTYEYTVDTEATKVSTGVYQLIISIDYTNESAGKWTVDVQALDVSDNSLEVTHDIFEVRKLATL